MFSARKKGNNPRGMGGSMCTDVGMDVGVGMDGCIDGDAKWPKNQWVMAVGDSE